MVVERLSKEKQIWKHYKDYLIEATGKSGPRLDHILAGIKTSVSVGCTRAELKEMMLNVFEPITIMQGLEQWQNQMDILLHTGLDSLSGKSRAEYYQQRNESPYVMEPDDILDNISADRIG